MDILFWSGGKDSYLSYLFYNSSCPGRPVSLLTTFNEETDIVPHQEIPIKRIKQQANHLDLPIYLIPLPPECPNEIYLEKIDQALNQIKTKSSRLIFGDRLALEIQNWREENFRKLGYKCFFPIEKKDTEELLAVLKQKPIKVCISAVQDELQDDIEVGELFNSTFVQRLPKEIDPMGEDGEFHTEVIFL